MDMLGIEYKDFIMKSASSKNSIDDIIRLAKGINGTVQIFGSRHIADRTHLVGAYANALIAFKNHTNKTRSLGMEMLLFAAMTDQIEVAIEISGARSSSDFIIFAEKKEALNLLKPLLSKSRDFDPSPSHIRYVARFFGIKGNAVLDIDAMLLQKMALSRLSSD